MSIVTYGRERRRNMGPVLLQICVGWDLGKHSRIMINRPRFLWEETVASEFDELRSNLWTWISVSDSKSIYQWRFAERVTMLDPSHTLSRFRLVTDVLKSLNESGEWFVPTIVFYFRLSTDNTSSFSLHSQYPALVGVNQCWTRITRVSDASIIGVGAHR